MRDIGEQLPWPLNSPPFPTPHNALAGRGMCQETLELHHGKHHQAYVTALNGFVEKNAGAAGQDRSRKSQAARNGKADMAPVFNNAGQHWNHILASGRACRRPAAASPASWKRSSLSDFGSVAAFKDAFKTAATTQFGSGWAWLVLGPTASSRSPRPPTRSTPLATGEGKALLVLDVWEHSYYLDFRNRRPDYAQNWLDKLANYEFAAAQLG